MILCTKLVFANFSFYLFLSFYFKETKHFISSEKALQYLKHPPSRVRKSLSSLHHECCHEFCSHEELREHRSTGSYVEDKIR